jgi:hypothetical protein
MEIDTPLEEWFGALQAAGMYYVTYIDYSQGRTLLHTVHVDPRSAVVRTAKAYAENGYTAAAPDAGPTCVSYPTLIDTAKTVGAVALINGIWGACDGTSVGYSYSTFGYLPSQVWCDDRFRSTTNCSDSDVYYAEGGGSLFPAGTSPMFTITGLGAGQQFNIVQSDDNFFEVPSTEWSQVGAPSYPIWDVSPRDGVSDVNYAIQIPNPPLVWNGAVIAGGEFVFDSAGNYDGAGARTSLGITPAGDLYLVVADGEGVMGGNGATGNQLAHFYRDVLGASAAMGLDSGLSTEMVLMGSTGLRHVNTLTGEDGTIQVDPYTTTLPEAAGSFGAVGYYLSVGSP